MENTLLKYLVNKAKKYKTIEEFTKALKKPLYKDSFGRDVIVINNKNYHIDTEFVKKGKWGIWHETIERNRYTGEMEKGLETFIPAIYPSKKQVINALFKQLEINPTLIWEEAQKIKD